MAKMFYTVEEAAKRLGKTEDELRALVREGTLREFRDAGSTNYKVDEVDQMAEAAGADSGGTAASSSGGIVLEPADDSSIELSPSGSDILSLEEVDASEATAAGSTTGTKAKEGSVIPSIGINVFDDDELDEAVDPLAQTAVSDVAGLGIDGTGSGSGIMNLTRESDDTSLGADLIDEIYTGDETTSDVEMGDATRAGLDEAIPEAPDGEEVFRPELDPSAKPKTTTVEVVEYGPDAVSSGLTALMVVAVVVMLVGGLSGAAMVRGVVPGIIEQIYDNLMIFAGAAVGVSVIAAGVTYILAKRSG